MSHTPNELADDLSLEVFKLISAVSTAAGEPPKHITLEVLVRILSVLADSQDQGSVMVILERHKIEGDAVWRSKVRFDYLDADPKDLLEFK